jgi:hypothetical protein
MGAPSNSPSREAIARRIPLERVDAGSWNPCFWIVFGARRAAFAARTRVTHVRARAHIFDDSVGMHSAPFQSQESILRWRAASLARCIAPDIQAKVHF